MDVPVHGGGTNIHESSAQRLLEPNIIISAPIISTVVRTVTPQTTLSNLQVPAPSSTEESGKNERKLMFQVVRRAFLLY